MIKIPAKNMGGKMLRVVRPTPAQDPLVFWFGVQASWFAQEATWYG